MAGRRRALDVLRAIAVILVLGRHMPAPPAELAGYGVLRAWMRFGWVGVDLFFVLSGFLVSGLLFTEFQRTQRLRIGRFLIRRGFKIYPPFYLLIFVALFAEAPTTHKLLAELFFFQNYSPGIFNHTWSLAVEEHFYLLLALGLALWTRMDNPRPRTIAALIGIGLAATLALRLAVLAHNANAFPMYQTHYRLDALGFGVLPSLAYHFHRDVLGTLVRRWRMPIVLASSALLLPSLLGSYRDPFVLGVGLTTNYLAFGGLLLVCLLSGWQTPRVLQPMARSLAAIGTSSYSIYLWHVPILHWVVPQLSELHHAWRLAIYFPLCVVVGIVLGKVIEQPFLRLRDRLTPNV